MNFPWYVKRSLFRPALLLAGFVLGAALGGASFTIWPKEYLSTARVLFAGSNSLNLPASLNIGSAGGGGATTARFDSLLGFGQNKGPNVDIVQAILTSQGASSRVIDKFGLQKALKLPKSRVVALQTIGRKHLTVKKVRSVIVEVSFQAPSAQLAHDCVAEYLNYCNDYTSRNAITSSRRTRIFIDGKVKENAEQIRELERNLGAFMDSKGLELMQAQPEVGGKILADVAKAHLESQALSVAWQARLDSLSSRSSDALRTAQEDLSSPVASGDPMISQLQANLSRSQLELDNLELTMTSAHPKVREARQKVAELRSQLETRLASSRQAAQRNQASELLSTAASADSAVALRDRQARQYDDAVSSLRKNAGLVVEQQVYKASLEGLLRKRELLMTEQTRARIAEEQESLKLEILDPPSLPDRHVWPKLSLLILGGAAIGALLAVCCNFWLSRPAK